MSASPHGRRRRIEPIIIGIVTIVAIAVGAATITSPTVGGYSPGDGPGVGLPGDDYGIDLGFPGAGGELGFGGEETTGLLLDLTWCSAFLTSGLGAAVYFGAFGGLLYGLKRRYSLGTAVFAGYGLSPVVLVAYFVSTSCATGGTSPEGPGGPIKPPEGPGTVLPELSPLVLVGAMGFVLLGTAVVVYRMTRDEQGETLERVEPHGASGTEPDVADLAAAASAAADRLEAHNADVDNEVYRAWWEMTTLLDVSNPHSSTPGEFANAAVEVGMRREDVAELTRLFEEVRYGGRDPGTREERAIEVFRAIGDEYADPA